MMEGLSGYARGAVRKTGVAVVGAGLLLASTTVGCDLLGTDFLEAVHDADRRVQEVEYAGKTDQGDLLREWAEQEDPDSDELLGLTRDWTEEDARLSGLLDEADDLLEPYADTGAGRQYLEATAKYREALEAQDALWAVIAERGEVYVLVIEGQGLIGEAIAAANSATDAGNANRWDEATTHSEEEERLATEAHAAFQRALEMDDSLGLGQIVAYAEKGIEIATLDREWATLGSTGPVASFNQKILEIEEAEAVQADMSLPAVWEDPLVAFGFQASAGEIDALWDEAFGLWTEVDDRIDAGEY